MGCGSVSGASAAAARSTATEARRVWQRRQRSSSTTASSSRAMERRLSSPVRGATSSTFATARACSARLASDHPNANTTATHPKRCTEIADKPTTTAGPLALYSGVLSLSLLVLRLMWWLCCCRARTMCAGPSTCLSAGSRAPALAARALLFFQCSSRRRGTPCACPTFGRHFREAFRSGTTCCCGCSCWWWWRW